MKKLTMTLALALPLFVLLSGCALFTGQAPSPYEVWTIDQADAAKGGAKLYIYSQKQVESTSTEVAPEVVDLDAGAQGVGDGPGIRPHLISFNSNHTYALIANVASGHVYFMRATDRRIVASIDVGEQAHAAFVSPDDKTVIVANQNGKKLALIHADFDRGTFTYNPAEDLDLKALEDEGHPDNAPICPILFTEGGKKAYITLRGGGLFVVDVSSAPMRVVKSYNKNEVAPAGCGGIALDKKVYINSGTATSSDLYVFEGPEDKLIKRINAASIGTDGHGLVLTGRGGYLWMGNRASSNIVVIDTKTDSIVATIKDFGKAPDIMDISPDGQRVFVALRGPNNVTGGAVAKGEMPGMVIITVKNGGASGIKEKFIPLGDQTPQSPNDPHSLAVRRIAQK